MRSVGLSDNDGVDPGASPRSIGTLGEPPSTVDSSVGVVVSTVGSAPAVSGVGVDGVGVAIVADLTHVDASRDAVKIVAEVDHRVLDDELKMVEALDGGADEVSELLWADKPKRWPGDRVDRDHTIGEEQPLELTKRPTGDHVGVGGLEPLDRHVGRELFGVERHADVREVNHVGTVGRPATVPPMEKTFALLWKPDSIAANAWRDVLLTDAVPACRADSDAAPSNITVFVVDSAVDCGKSLHMGPERPAGAISWWTDRSDLSAGVLATLGEHASRVEAYLVVESVPLPHDDTPRPGTRSDGFVNMACIAPKPGLSGDEFRDLWFDEHCHVALDTQSTTVYVRNEIVRALTPGAPDWAGIVEETFPLGALDDSAVFFDAVDDADRLARHQHLMFQSVDAFLDLSRIEAHPMSEYRLG